MPRSPRTLAALALIVALALSGCDMAPGSATAPDTTVVVEEQPAGQPPEPTCPPAAATPEPDLSGDRDGDDINDVRPVPDDC